MGFRGVGNVGVRRFEGLGRSRGLFLAPVDGVVMLGGGWLFLFVTLLEGTHQLTAPNGGTGFDSLQFLARDHVFVTVRTLLTCLTSSFIISFIREYNELESEFLSLVEPLLGPG